MKKSVTAVAILLGLSSMSALAVQDNAFQHEAGLNYQSNSEEFGDGLWKANYSYYVTPVDQSSSPYALNGFLAQSSNLGAYYSNFDDADLDSYGIDGTYVFASKWFVGVNYQKHDYAHFDFDTYGAEVGYYFNDSSAVSVFYADGDEGIEERYGVKVRSYIALQSTAGVDLQANWTHSDNDDMINLGADWYVNNAWSVGLGYTDTEYDDAFDVRTSYWLRISDNVSANFQVARVLDSDFDGVNIGLGLVGRF
ncbi:putative porin [Shewanella marisflavi]|uniref:putative porin n=1 Tax=Shewanella marisflavi TaxID=260364 RepID=UPI002010779B|nr:putative porin [Shewanella marisflavi]MCL1041980.1 putative porin [Shewanella marisflavi]